MFKTLKVKLIWSSKRYFELLSTFSVFAQISPIILNTVLTITAAMTPKPTNEQDNQKPVDLSTLWAVRDIYSCNYWFLDVETATEVTERFQEVHSSSTAQTFSADVKVVQVTLESGQGHHTVPLLLAESSFSGCARNWSSLLSMSADMTLEVGVLAGSTPELLGFFIKISKTLYFLTFHMFLHCFHNY